MKRIPDSVRKRETVPSADSAPIPYEYDYEVQVTCNIHGKNYNPQHTQSQFTKPWNVLVVAEGTPYGAERKLPVYRCTPGRAQIVWRFISTQRVKSKE